MHIPQTSAQRANKHPPIDIYPPIVGRIYPIPVYIQTAYDKVQEWS